MLCGLHVGKHDFVESNHALRYNVHLVERFLGGNKIKFYSSNLCTVNTKNFYVHLDHRFYESNRSPIRFQTLNFGEEDIVVFYTCGFHVL